jgi:hypothetical protein
MLPLTLLKTAQLHPVVRLCGTRIVALCPDRGQPPPLDPPPPPPPHPPPPLSLPPTKHPPPPPKKKTSQLVELKNGETYNGNLVNCDTWMNIHLREVICTSKVRPRQEG